MLFKSMHSKLNQNTTPKKPIREEKSIRRADMNSTSSVQLFACLRNLV